MPDPLLASLSEGETVHVCSLATVTTTCVVIRTASARSRAIVSLRRISGIQTVKTAYPAFLAIAAGLFLIAAAAHFSKDGGAADIPLASLGVVSTLAYFLSRKAAIVFWTGRESVETIRGGLREAANLVIAVENAYSAMPESQSSAAMAS